MCPASPGRAVTPQNGQMGARPSSSILIYSQYVVTDGNAFNSKPADWGTPREES
jgi:hypothetical protein